VMDLYWEEGKPTPIKRCPKCEGRGYYWANIRCHTCAGSGFVDDVEEAEREV